ncbi:MAG TPA: DNA double-strand break repair nuclease NurA [Actinomycetota bacterium]|nr:DNA double-strand break repair nuclease NurA [Actinomycetota bacterium]
MLVLRADPWSADYGMGYEAVADDTPFPSADPFVETTDWSRPIPATATATGPLWFVDGVRRVELRLVAEQDGERVPGLFGSYGVGAVVCDGTARFDDHCIRRAVVLCCGVMPERAELSVGTASLVFDPTTDPGSDPNRALLRLQELMRAEEDALAARLLLHGAALVLVDGPLRLGSEPNDAPMVGVVKRFVRRYLEPEHESLLGRLRPGERTPLFGLVDQQADLRGYSWYTRLADAGPPWHDHAGIVRCEVRAGVRLDGARGLADRTTALLPAYAGRPTDPRAPQNLAPVAGLEGWLRHRMGDHRMIRRSLLAWLAGGSRGGEGSG